MSLVLGFLHGLDFLNTHLLIGSVVFYSMILPAGGAPAMGLKSAWVRNLRVLFFMAFMSSFLWMLFSSADMAESWSVSDLWSAMGHTSFGHVWCLRLGFLLLLFFSTRELIATRTRTRLLTILVLIIPVFSSLTSHAAVQESGVFWRVGIDWIHSIAVAVWSGGLWRLFRWLGTRLTSSEIAPTVSFAVVKRFSHFAMVSTGGIAVTGLVMARVAGVSISHPWESDYGKLVLTKVALFLLALAAASINQFIHIRRWTEMDELSFVRRIRRGVCLEFLLVLIAFMVAGFLTRTMPPGT